MKLGVIGAGKIVHFHLPALRAAGFTLHGIASRKNSRNPLEVAKKFDVKRVYQDANELISNSQQFDAILLASASDTLVDYLVMLKTRSIPVLVEKPLFSNSEDMKKAHFWNLDSEKIMVGYNRRFYPSISSLRKRILEGGHGLLNVVVPELSGNTDYNLQEIKDCLRLNTVHIFDLIYFLFDGQNFSKNVFVHWNENLPKGIVVVLQNKKFLINLRITFGTPGNYKFEYCNDNFLSTLEPIEKVNHFSGMQVIEPTSDFPLRRYQPQRIDFEIDKYNLDYKPGFLEQSKHFFSLASGVLVKDHASIRDAMRVSLFVEEIIKNLDE